MRRKIRSCLMFNSARTPRNFKKEKRKKLIKGWFLRDRRFTYRMTRTFRSIDFNLLWNWQKNIYIRISEISFSRTATRPKSQIYTKLTVKALTTNLSTLFSLLVQSLFSKLVIKDQNNVERTLIMKLVHLKNYLILGLMSPC